MNSLLKHALVFAVLIVFGSVNGVAGEFEKRQTRSTVALMQSYKSADVASKMAGEDLDKIFVLGEIGHGTHLCSADSHCGSGHKCCSGHCKAVRTCGR